ncbi:hypothetical protein GSI_07534 [Ganoderma sinense ZZ0214-1]|uniref:Protein kinase domain-containing protein n=1 Tax=Ganoderma sinense ZZ0214-1 TaxID=1077348 RepID=A0A2G8S9C0_9APHY|nr:hypothetical protein GSI_07534 [Ganoderma sinense ZZ0214-1]
MGGTEFRAMLNIEPYHFEFTFRKPYECIKASDVLDAAAGFLARYTHQHAQPMDARGVLLLRYLEEEDAFTAGSKHLPGDPISNEYPSTYTRLAANWCWTTGCNLSTKAVDGGSLLSYWAESHDATKVRWYVLLSVDPTPQFVPQGLKDGYELANQRRRYMEFVRTDVAARIATGLPSPSKVSAGVSKLPPEQKERTPISNGLCTRSDYGVNPIVIVPIFAEAHNMLRNLHLVNLELSSDLNGVNVKRTACKLIIAANKKCKNEKEFNTGIFEVLKELLHTEIFEFHLHYTLYDDRGKPLTELDWVAFCRTAHGWVCVPFSGEGKQRRGVGGDSILQNFCALQRLLAMDAKLRRFMELTACPILMLGVEGTDMRVWCMIFGAKICGSRLFDASLRKDMTALERLDLAIKLQIVRNTVRKLCEYYGSLHAATRPPTAPFLFPQPLALLQRLVPSPPPAVLDHLVSLRLHILETVETSKNPTRSLYSGVIFNVGWAAIPVLVKIVPSKYGAAAHQLLAEHDPPYAPRLFWCHEIIVGYTMVVMAKLEKPLVRDSLHPCKQDVDIVQRDIGEALRILHGANFVHGDVRQPNIIMTNDERAYLIDFDSADLAGVAEYPESLNPKIRWSGPASTLVSMPILKQHDLDRFQWTIDELNGVKVLPIPEKEPQQDAQEQEEIAEVAVDDGVDIELQLALAGGRIAF